MAGMSSAPTAATVPGPEPENGREECTGKDGHDGKPTRDLAHRRLHHIHKVLRNSAAPHDGPGQHETWNRHQCVLVHPGIQGLCETFQRFAIQDELHQWAYAQRDEDGQTYAETTYDEETKQHMSPQLAERYGTDAELSAGP